MGRSAPDATKKDGRSFLSFLAWWKTDPAEIEKQVVSYDTMKVWQSARGISMLLSAFSVAMTVLLGGYMGLSGGTIITEALIWGILGFAMFRGQQWAFVAGMILWTFEKGALLFAGTAIGRTPIVQIIWWVVYMSAFMLGFRVEKARKAKAPVAVAPVQ